MTHKRSAWATRLLVVSALSAMPLVATAQQPGKPLTPEQMREQMQQRGYGPGYGPGMMGGGYGYGMGPGMMGGYGYGPGMMGMMGGYGGGYGMGPGMMGGYGGGYGMGPGMMGGGMGPLYMLNLSDAQRDKIEKIHDAEHQKHWDITGKILEEQNKLRDLYQSDPQDPKKIGAAYGNIAKLQQQMIEIHVQANNDAQKALTKEQREQLKQWYRGMWGQGGDYPQGMGPGMMQRR
jgi:Spy/CpxP family protein refolding chaperone